MQTAPPPSSRPAGSSGLRISHRDRTREARPGTKPSPSPHTAPTPASSTGIRVSSRSTDLRRRRRWDPDLFFGGIFEDFSPVSLIPSLRCCPRRGPPIASRIKTEFSTLKSSFFPPFFWLFFFLLLVVAWFLAHSALPALRFPSASGLSWAPALFIPKFPALIRWLLHVEDLSFPGFYGVFPAVFREPPPPPP